MTDRTYAEAYDAALRGLTRGEADEAIHALYLTGRSTADAYIAYLREELHEAWSRLYAHDHPEEDLPDSAREIEPAHRGVWGDLPRMDRDYRRACERPRNAAPGGTADPG